MSGLKMKKDILVYTVEYVWLLRNCSRAYHFLAIVKGDH